MGVLPLQFMHKENRKSLKLQGSEKISISGLNKELKTGMTLKMMVEYEDGNNLSTTVKLLANTKTEIDYLETGGILQYVFKALVNS
mgnify:CR=1 FL=1